MTRPMMRSTSLKRNTTTAIAPAHPQRRRRHYLSNLSNSGSGGAYPRPSTNLHNSSSSAAEGASLDASSPPELNPAVVEALEKVAEAMAVAEETAKKVELLPSAKEPSTVSFYLIYYCHFRDIYMPQVQSIHSPHSRCLISNKNFQFSHDPLDQKSHLFNLLII